MNNEQKFNRNRNNDQNFRRNQNRRLDEYGNVKKRKIKGSPKRFLFIIAFALIPLGIIFIPQFLDDRKRANLEEVGIEATAKLLSYERTGTTMNSIYKLRFKLQITPENKDSYIGKCKAYIDPIHYYKLKPGLVLPVLIDPEDADNFAVEWKKAGIKRAF